MSVGKMKEFVVNTGNWSGYVERMEMYFLVNKVTSELKLPTLISVMGEEAYELLSTLASPVKPKSLTYERAVELLAAHLQPTPSVLTERYKFRQRRQRDESIAEYVSELKKLSKYCDFGSALDENLRDQLVCGLKSEIIRQRLFSEEKLEYKRAVTLALSLEAAERDANAVEGSSSTALAAPAEGVHRFNVGECSRCGDKRHQSTNCLFKDYVCSWCNEIGHLRRVCPKKDFKGPGYNQKRRSDGAEAAGYYEARSGRGRGYSRRAGGGGSGGGRGRQARGQRGAGRGSQERAPLHLLDEEDEAYWNDNSNFLENDGNRDDGDDEPMYQMSLANYKPVCIKIKVQNCFLKMEVDTGSALSCISRNVYDKCFSKINLNPCHINLRFYDGTVIQPLGFIETVVVYNGVSKVLDLYVIDRGTTNLLGRQWLAELNIPIRIAKDNLQTNHVAHSELDVNKIINEIVSRHESLFDGTLGRYRGGTAELCVREGAGPTFGRCRMRCGSA